jgi:hypothetical protein
MGFNYDHVIAKPANQTDAQTIEYQVRWASLRSKKYADHRKPLASRRVMGFDNR